MEFTIPYSFTTDFHLLSWFINLPDSIVCTIFSSNTKLDRCYWIWLIDNTVILIVLVWNMSYTVWNEVVKKPGSDRHKFGCIHTYLLFTVNVLYWISLFWYVNQLLIVSRNACYNLQKKCRQEITDMWLSKVKWFEMDVYVHKPCMPSM